VGQGKVAYTFNPRSVSGDKGLGGLFDISLDAQQQIGMLCFQQFAESVYTMGIQPVPDTLKSLRCAGCVQYDAVGNRAHSVDQFAVSRMEQKHQIMRRIGGQRLHPEDGHDLMTAEIGVVVVYDDFHMET
jgi:hypothetical protein